MYPTPRPIDMWEAQCAALLDPKIGAAAPAPEMGGGHSSPQCTPSSSLTDLGVGQSAPQIWGGARLNPLHPSPPEAWATHPTASPTQPHRSTGPCAQAPPKPLSSHIDLGGAGPAAPRTHLQPRISMGHVPQPHNCWAPPRPSQTPSSPTDLCPSPQTPPAAPQIHIPTPPPEPSSVPLFPPLPAPQIYGSPPPTSPSPYSTPTRTRWLWGRSRAPAPGSHNPSWEKRELKEKNKMGGDTR